MAVKRMFSNHIVDTDAFLDMPVSSQLLYFHLSMRADDEGFVGSPKKIMRMCGFQEDDFKVLIAKRFILTFKSGVVVIKHWLIHNTIRMDRFNPTNYCKEKETLQIKTNKAYTEANKPTGNQMATSGCPKLSKVKLIKVSISFEKFWNLYDKKIGKPKCEKKWKRLSGKEQQAIIDFLPQYINATPDKKFRKNPETFLNNRSWEDEIIKLKSSTIML